MKSSPGYPRALLRLTVSLELGPSLLEGTGVVKYWGPPEVLRRAVLSPLLTLSVLKVKRVGLPFPQVGEMEELK